MLLPLLLNLSCNNFVETPMYENYLWTCCNMWLVVLNHVRSWFVRWFVWDPSWFHWTTRFIWVQVWQFDRFGDCYYTCALINWTVLLHASTRRNQSDATVAVRKCQGSQGGLHHCHQGLRGSVSHKPPPLGLELCLGGLQVHLPSMQVVCLLLKVGHVATGTLVRRHEPGLLLRLSLAVNVVAHVRRGVVVNVVGVVLRSM